VPGRAYIGTSGWNYPAWRGDFYRGVPQRRWLAHCARHFDSVEINATFYRQPKVEILHRWRDETPAGFRFSAKAHRFITHVRRLRDPAAGVARERALLSGLAPKLAVVLWQLPASLQRDRARLEALARALDDWPEVRHAIEFRHRSWFDDQVADCLAAHGLANCQSDAADWPLWDRVTTDLVYVRLHGHTRTYASRYHPASLRAWAGRIRGWLAEDRDVYVYFDNDAEGWAPRDALALKGLLA